VAVHGGRVFKTMGDGALAEFPSAVEAVAAALEIQAAMVAFNAARTGAPPIAFRIGVNMGDVVLEGDDVLGDGVNVAARLEPLAPVGGLLLSDAVHIHVRGKVGAEFGDGGAVGLKNIAEPVRVWHWPAEARLSAGAARPAPPAADRPAVAVLPFSNLSGRPDEAYFSDGISEDIITDLSKVGGLTVVARNSSFAWRDRAEDVRVVGRELGVTSVVEGSIRRAGNRVRISAQLVDARSGHHLWAERYDRDLTDIFAVQDEVTFQIVDALKVRLAPAERARIAAPATQNLEAHDLLLRARELSTQLLQSPADAPHLFARMIADLDRAILLDPGFAQALAGRSMAWTIDLVNGWSGQPDPLSRALADARAAVLADPGESYAHNALAVASLYIPDLAATQASARRALELNPNSASAHTVLGHALAYLGDPQAGVPHLETAKRLDPVNTHQAQHFLGLALMMAGDWAGAAEAFRERIRLSPRTDLSRAFLAACLGRLGQVEAAQAVWAELMAINPGYSFARHVERLPFRSDEDRLRIARGLAAAGLPAAPYA
jgi:adenylate cyclase